MKLFSISPVPLFILAAVALAVAQTPTPRIDADFYGTGPHAIILAHGGRFDKDSWRPQAQTLANAGFRVLTLRFRGDKHNPDGTPSAEGSGPENTADVLAAIAYLQHHGATSIYAIGGSLGGDAVGEANARSKPNTIARIIFLGSEGGDLPEKLTGRKLFIVARDDSNGAGPRLPGITAHYEKAQQPKKLLILEGTAHAQYLFATDQAPRLMKEILRFFSEP